MVFFFSLNSSLLGEGRHWRDSVWSYFEFGKVWLKQRYGAFQKQFRKFMESSVIFLAVCLCFFGHMWSRCLMRCNFSEFIALIFRFCFLCVLSFEELWTLTVKILMYLIHTNHSSAVFCELVFASYLLTWDSIKHPGDRSGSVGDPSLFSDKVSINRGCLWNYFGAILVGFLFLFIYHFKIWPCCWLHLFEF